MRRGPTRSQGGKSNHPEEPDRGTFWRGTAIDVDTRLRVGRAIGKNEEEVAAVMMLQIRDRCNPIEPPAISSDGNDSYPEAMLETWGKLPEYTGIGRPPTRKNRAWLEMPSSDEASIWCGGSSASLTE